MKKIIGNTFARSIFIDSSNLDEISKWNQTGVIDGVTTNQMIMLQDRLKIKDYYKIIKSICREMKDKPVSVELSNSQATIDEMVREAKKLDKLAENIVIKVPLIPNTTKSLLVIKQLAEENIAVNATLMMTFEQLVMAIGAVRYCRRPSFVSIFWGRTIEDHAKYRSRSDFMAKFPRVGGESWVDSDPKNIVAAASQFLKEGKMENPKIIVGSVRTSSMVGEAFAAGGNIVTCAPDLLLAMLFSQRTLETAIQFDEAWRKLQ